MKEQLFEMVDSLKEELIQEVCNLVSINSIKDTPLNDAPFGKGCKEVLDYIIDLGKQDGFLTKNVDGYMAYVQSHPGDKHIGVFGHLDVVSVEGEWMYPPFSATIADGRIYGRGALDNKGPIMAAYFALKALKKVGVTLKHPIRIVFGADEESGMSDIEYYLKKEPLPYMGFTPDNKFPAIYGYRGRAVVSVTGNKEAIREVMDLYFKDENPLHKLGIYRYDEDFKELILRNIRVINEEPMEFVFTLCYGKCDIEEVVQAMQKEVSNVTFKIVSNSPYILKDKKEPLVLTLNRVYNEVMHQQLQPTTTTGMTYANKCSTIIPFGPSFPGQNGIAHLPNEWMNIEDLVLCCKIYAYALYCLANQG
ncbi:MAG: Sapep family Mn(2+)-dependent dipeptidase [Erysipelotrichaceae bacterium]|nr:Sapep family Mn(2+)-dependent dipeptidase [Erysipelotrichaceae bacterium]